MKQRFAKIIKGLKYFVFVFINSSLRDIFVRFNMGERGGVGEGLFVLTKHMIVGLAHGTSVMVRDIAENIDSRWIEHGVCLDDRKGFPLCRKKALVRRDKTGKVPARRVTHEVHVVRIARR